VSEPLVVIGNGMAAARFVGELADVALGRHAVAVVGEEPRLAYNRVLLSSLLAEEISASDIELKSARWWQERGVTLRYGCAATAIDRFKRTVTLADGRELRFSKLVIATGSRAIKPDVPGMELPGVLTFRDLADVGAMAESAGRGIQIAVIGGGLLGIEAASGLAKRGARVTLIHLMDRLMERQLDPQASHMLKGEIEKRGVRVLLNAETGCIEGAERASGVALKDGTRIDADLVVVAIGIRPNIELAEQAGVITDRGIAVNGRLETSAAGIYAIGECVQHEGHCYGLVEPAYEQARALAWHLAGRSERYEGSVLSTNLKVSGVSVFSAGNFLGGEGSEEIVLSDPGFGAYKKLVIRNNKLIGAVLYGDAADALWYRDLIRSGESIQSFRDELAFGQANLSRAAA
jgi:nitrite reductase (NADH) large subunit